MTDPWLSILMPTYNGQAHLADALDSVLRQGDEGIECIVVDDGSTDATLSILDSYKAKLRMRILAAPRSGNWAANTNMALSAAGGSFVSILHQDDMWMEGRLRAIKKLTEQFPEINIFISPSRYVNMKGERVGLLRCPLPALPVMIDADTMIERLLIQNFISIPAPVFRRETALSCGGLDGGFWYASDWDLWLKMAALGRIGYYPAPLSEFRVHPYSLTVTRSDDIEEFRRELETVLERHLKAWKVTGRVKDPVVRAARFSIEMNVFLASLFHGKKGSLFKLLSSFIGMPLEWHRYLRDSRLTERLFGRVRGAMEKAYEV